MQYTQACKIKSNLLSFSSTLTVKRCFPQMLWNTSFIQSSLQALSLWKSLRFRVDNKSLLFSCCHKLEWKFLSMQHDRKRHVYVCPYNRAKTVVRQQSSSLCQSIHDTMCNLMFKGLNACQESTRPGPILVWLTCTHAWWSWATMALSCNPEVFVTF